MSTSYSDNEDTIDPAYLAATELLIMQLGARGVSMLHASGDGGVAGTQAGVQPCGGARPFLPTWPASSPWVTAVGSTDTTFAKASGFSGGGFSNVHAAPPYQAAAIAAYKKTAGAALPPAARYNQTGRGIPDVAAVGEYFSIVVNGRVESVAGTSCSTPAFAGVVALLNDARVAAGKKPLGFLNQIFYAHPEVFTDIEKGSNPGCGTNGFPAVAGYDPVTGLGAPKYAALRALAMSLP